MLYSLALLGVKDTRNIGDLFYTNNLTALDEKR